MEDTDVALAAIEADFGPEVARIVDGVTKLDRVQYDTREQQQAASVRKMIVAIARDLRVLIIKLADRLHNLRTLAVLPAFKQDYIARETPRRVCAPGPPPRDAGHQAAAGGSRLRRP